MEIGATINQYRIIDRIGKGGMGIVYLAEDTRLHRNVALKFISNLSPDSTEEIARFQREAQAAARLNHPNICTVHELGETDDQTYIAMEYVEGVTLKDRLRKGGITEHDIRDWLKQIAEGLHAAHEAGVVHRDIKPANIMITSKGLIKIMDFGLAKLLENESELTQANSTIGTIVYMSPEQANGEEIDQRTDIWSVGVILYELLTGRRPFEGEFLGAVLYAIMHGEIKPPSLIKSDTPNDLETIVERCLQRNQDDRYSSIDSLITDLISSSQSSNFSTSSVQELESNRLELEKDAVSIPLSKSKKYITAKLSYALTGALVILAVGVAVTWLTNRQAKIKWAQEEILPEIQRIAADHSWSGVIDTEAYFLADEAEKYIPKDATLQQLMRQISVNIPIASEPADAQVFWKPYQASDTQWVFLGRTPLDSVRLPRGIIHLKLEKTGYRTFQLGLWPPSTFNPGPGPITLSKSGSYPQDMEWIPGQAGMAIEEPYLFDQYEVTNQDFREFVDNGGYEKLDYWEHPFEKEGQIITFEVAMSQFVDQTGRNGPSTWEAGNYPIGEDDLPVGGISWFEAAAYAKYAGKILPSISHWKRAAEMRLGYLMIPNSNYNHQKAVPVGNSNSSSLHGIYDMAGNVREWVWNESMPSRRRYILGGGWNDPPYVFHDESSLSPWDRSAMNGFRLMMTQESNVNKTELFQPLQPAIRDFYSEQPVSDETFEVFLRQYAYDSPPLDALVEYVDSSNTDWSKLKVTFNAAYGNERMAAFLFLPKQSSPPYKTVIYYPGIGARYSESSEDLFGMRFIDYLMRDGRAVLYPVYQGTYERNDSLLVRAHSSPYSQRDYTIMLVKDLRRSIDYLETREDIDSSKLAYYGVSWGGSLGPIMAAVEDRIQVCIFLLGGLGFGSVLPEIDAFNFVSRVEIPVLMLGGEYDSVHPLPTSQKPMFDFLSTPLEHKRHVVLDRGHDLPRSDMIRETLDWLDKYQ